MKRLKLSIYLTAILITILVLSPTKAQEGRPEYAGIWGAWGSESHQQSWLKGSMLNASWKNIEPSDGQFNFSSLDNKITAAVSNNQYFLALIYIDNPPLWLFEEKGVPKVYLDYGGHQASWEPDYFPYYLDSTYQFYQARMWSALQKYIASLSAEKREKFVGFQVPMGRSGDEQPYPGKVIDKQYDLPWNGDNAGAWTNYQVETLKIFLDSLKANGLYENGFYPIFNLTPPAEDLAVAEGININRKSGVVAQAYHMNGEMGSARVKLRNIINALQPDSSDYVRCRGEFDNNVKNESSWLAAAPVWHYYWHCHWMLTYGLDLFMQRTQTIETGDLHKRAFDFFNARAGYKDVKTARYAYVSLRDGLDILDTKRFPEYNYGALSNKSKRFETILRMMAPYGARNDDKESQTITGDWSYLNSRKAMNDACQNNWPGNYGRYLNQIEPNMHDQGYWRVGSKQEPYGRFARGFDVANNKNTLYFDLNDEFFGEEKTAPKKIRLKIIYFGGDTGSWELKYHAADGTMKTAISVDNPVDLGRWVTKGIVLTDALLNNGGEKGADLILQNTGNTNCRFHLIEIDRETEETSSDATLLDLKVNGETVHGFNPGDTVYEVSLPKNTEKINLFAQPTDAFASIAITDSTEIPGSAVIKVTADDSVTTKQYTINFTKAISTDATLFDLQIDSVTIPDFDPATTFYTVELPAGTTTVPTVFATPTDSGSQVSVHEASSLSGSTVIFVTAEDGITTIKYAINFTVDVSSKVANNPGANSFQVYPNPLNQESLIVNLDEKGTYYSVSIFDITGNIISRQNKINGTYRIPRESFIEKGIYIIEIDNGTSIKTYNKIIVR